METGKKLKVCILCTAYPRFSNDYINPFMHDFAKEFAKYYDVSVVTSCDKTGEKTQLIDNVKIYRFQYFFPRSLQTLTYTGGMNESFKKSLLAKLQTPFFMLAFMLKSLGKCKNADIIHAHWTLSGFVAILLKKLYRKPVVLTLHGGDVRFLPKWFNRLVLRNVDITISAHDDLIEEAKKMGCKRILNIKNMMDFGRFKNISGDYFRKEFGIKSEPIVAFVGRMELIKDPFTFIKSARFVANKIPGVRFFLAGDGHYKAEVIALIKKLKLEHNVFYIGPRTDVNRILAASTVFVSITTVENCFLTSVIEAMSSGVPCILSKAGMTERFFTHKKDSYLIPTGDEAALGRAVVSLINNRKLREEIVRGSKEFLKRNGFSEEIITKKIQKVYADLAPLD